jgi:hypothetical protein
MYVAPPPKLNDLFDEVSPQRLLDLAQRRSEFVDSDEYVHWDKLRHLTPPGDLTLKEWWFRLRARSAYVVRTWPPRHTGFSLGAEGGALGLGFALLGATGHQARSLLCSCRASRRGVQSFFCCSWVAGRVTRRQRSADGGYKYPSTADGSFDVVSENVPGFPRVCERALTTAHISSALRGPYPSQHGRKIPANKVFATRVAEYMF